MGSLASGSGEVALVNSGSLNLLKSPGISKKSEVRFGIIKGVPLGSRSQRNRRGL